jgi:hypothetical protein
MHSSLICCLADPDDGGDGGDCDDVGRRRLAESGHRGGLQRERTHKANKRTHTQRRRLRAKAEAGDANGNANGNGNGNLSSCKKDFCLFLCERYFSPALFLVFARVLEEHICLLCSFVCPFVWCAARRLLAARSFAGISVLWF